MNSLFGEFGPQGVVFRLVYIAEAHSTDEWPISSARYTSDGEPVQLRQPRTASERIDAATQYRAAYGITMPVLVDPPLPPHGGSQPAESSGDPVVGDGGERTTGHHRQYQYQPAEGEPEAGITASFGADGAFEAAYAPWPLRFYGCTKGTGKEEEGWVLRYIASPRQCTYSLAELREWLLETLQQPRPPSHEDGSQQQGEPMLLPAPALGDPSRR